MSRFEQQYNQLRTEESFSGREVGLNHPDNSSFIKVADNGDITLSVGTGCSIIMSSVNKSITFVADNVKFLVRDEDGVKINDLILNSKATKYSEPTFIERDPSEYNYLYDDVNSYVTDPGGGDV